MDDDVDFLNSYGSLRSRTSTKAYRDGWDRIFGSADRDENSVEVYLPDEPKYLGGNE